MFFVSYKPPLDIHVFSSHRVLHVTLPLAPDRLLCLSQFASSRRCLQPLDLEPFRLLPVSLTTTYPRCSLDATFPRCLWTPPSPVLEPGTRQRCLPYLGCLSEVSGHLGRSSTHSRGGEALGSLGCGSAGGGGSAQPQASLSIPAQATWKVKVRFDRQIRQ
jgi:hypothetical protein